MTFRSKTCISWPLTPIRLFNRRDKKITRNVVERISICSRLPASEYADLNADGL